MTVPLVERIRMAWHVLRGRPLIFNNRFEGESGAALHLAFDQPLRTTFAYNVLIQERKPLRQPFPDRKET